jgi:hypothetical protein
MSIDWNALRTLDGSQHKAFEELCCQLAAHEPMPPGSTFVRVAAPDAGTECYWTLPNGDERAWQAKFFNSPPGDTQWGELDKSVKTALKKHPRLTSYTICIPLDRQDPRREEHQWFMDRWNQHVEKWKRWAPDKGMAVEFPYWGEHEIFTRLSREEHRGRYFFWFNKEFFSNQWFSERIDEAVANAGPRYTPELNVELPVAQLFDGLGRTSAFFDRFDEQVSAVKQAHREAASRNAREVAESEYNTLAQRIKVFSDAATNAKKDGVGPIDWRSLVESVSAAFNAIEACIGKLEELSKEKTTAVEEEQRLQRQKELYSSARYSLHHLRGVVYF